MFLNHNEEPVEIKIKCGSTRKFKLVEHTGNELDRYIEKTASKYDEAIEQMRIAQRSIQYGQEIDESVLMKVKDQVAEESASIIAELLIPDDGNERVDGDWVRRNTTRRMREQILLKQNELDGIETIQEQSFLIERGALIAALQVRQARQQKSIPESRELQEEI